ncbi:aldolase/citrate lyase family protein [Bacillus salipaludis]|uniref:Aldolase/citrate lyase family protein n=1 Tax=Bacillus salipaludis TaxID=2547811 RepID=A0AA90TVX5_9BACI|nr:aldolase/citrate lyase family protein [Bacillus salipaludis]MDQ6598138.1 aldolase/citrate lyase family protein [Bacillus salipaludis]
MVNLVPIIRVSFDASSIQKALDREAKGIQVPMVNNKEDAELVVKRAKFPPHGQRAAAFVIRAARFGKDGGELILIMQVRIS